MTSVDNNKEQPLLKEPIIEEKGKFPDFINKYGKEVGLPNLKFNENGVCSLCFDEKINVDIVYNEKNDQCFFASPICTIPDKEQEKFYEQLLLDNSNISDNKGALFGIEEEQNRVVLSYTFIASTFTFEHFKTSLNNFVVLTERNTLKYEIF